MDNAPLTQAHTHACNASHETDGGNISAASTEHDLAAAEFAKAADSTHDSEVNRILRLLQEHHRQLSRAIKLDPRPRTAHLDAVSEEEPSQAVATSPTSASTPLHDRPASPTQTRTSPSARRRPPRDLGSSTIAKDLASARGIPGSTQRRSSPVSPTVTTHNVSRDRQKAVLSTAVEATRHHLRSDAERAGIPRSVVPLQAQPEEAERTKSPSRSPNDAAFNRFYSQFEGLLTTLTAPLVFAGFPLSSGSSAKPGDADGNMAVPATTDQRTTDAHSRRPTAAAPLPPSAPSPADPEQLNSLISRAAIRALKDTRGLSAAESFYVVPTSGGTVSYAGIVTRDGQPSSGPRAGHERDQGRPRSRHSTATSFNEEFVDASETPQPPSPTASRSTHRESGANDPLQRSGHLGTAKQGARFVTPSAGGKLARDKTLEELELETQKQRETIDLLAKRLLMWETSSQRNAMALAESMRSTRGSSRHGGPPSLSRDSTGRTEADSDIPPVPPLPASIRPITDTMAGKGATATSTNNKAFDAKGGSHNDLPEGMTLQELRDLLDKERKDREKLAKQNEKLTTVLDRYREKWEELKAGAKARVAAREREKRQAQASANGAGTAMDKEGESNAADALGSVEEGV